MTLAQIPEFGFFVQNSRIGVKRHFQGELDYETASMVKLYTTESINRNVTKASFPIYQCFVDFTSRNSKTYKSYCNYGVVGVTCGNIPSQKHSLVLVSKLFMLVLLKLCANSFQEVFILVELNKKIRPTVSCLVWPKTVHFRADRPLSRDLILRRLRILHFGPNCFIRKSL